MKGHEGKINQRSSDPRLSVLIRGKVSGFPDYGDSGDFCGLGFKGFPLRPFVSFVVNGFALPIPAIPAIPAITRDSGD